MPSEMDSKTAGGTTELMLLTPIKKGLVPGGHPQTYLERLRFILWSVEQRIQGGVSTPVQRVGTIHFARWAILPAIDPQLPYAGQLLFTSDFDGTLRAYLRSFNEIIGPDIDNIWQNCLGYPEGGTRNFDQWWDYAKRHQVECQAYYCAYPSRTVRDILRAEEMKQQLDAFWRRENQEGGEPAPGLRERLARLIAGFLTFYTERRL